MTVIRTGQTEETLSDALAFTKACEAAELHPADGRKLLVELARLPIEQIRRMCLTAHEQHEARALRAEMRAHEAEARRLRRLLEGG